MLPPLIINYIYNDMKPSFFSESNSRMPYVDYSYSKENRPVQDGLNITPAQMMQASQEGIAIQPTMTGATPLEDSIANAGFEVAAIFERGADFCTVWNSQMDARQAISKGVNSLVSQGNYGIQKGGE